MTFLLFILGFEVLLWFADLAWAKHCQAHALTCSRRAEQVKQQQKELRELAMQPRQH